MATKTTNFGLSKPIPNDPTDQDVWGSELNTNADGLDSVVEYALNFVPVVKTIDFTVTAPTTQSTTIGDTKKLFLCDATSGAWSATLPYAATAGNFTVAFKKTDATASAITVLAASGEKIDGASSWALSAQNDFVVISSDGVSAWQIVGRSPPAVSAQTISDKTLLGNVSGSTATPSALTVTQFLDSTIGSSQGTLLYRGASTWSALAPGTNGYYLKTQGAGANPTWANASGSYVSQDQNYNNVGSFCFCYFYGNSVNHSIDAGYTVAGSLLEPCSIYVSGSVSYQHSGVAMTGTWRCLGYAPNMYGTSDRMLTLFQRIA